MKDNILTPFYGFKSDNNKPYIYNHAKNESQQTQNKENKLVIYSQNGLYELVKNTHDLAGIKKSLPKEGFLCSVIIAA